MRMYRVESRPNPFFSLSPSYFEDEQGLVHPKGNQQERIYRVEYGSYLKKRIVNYQVLRGNRIMKTTGEKKSVPVTEIPSYGHYSV